MITLLASNRSKDLKLRMLVFRNRHKAFYYAKLLPLFAIVNVDWRRSSRNG